MEVRKKNGCLVWFVVAVVSSLGAVASASATLWLHEGKSLEKAELATGHGSSVFHHTGGVAGTFSIRCTGLVSGTVGPGAKGTVESLEGLKKEIDQETCEFIEGGNCANAGQTVLLHALNLPWHSLLELISGKTWNHVLEESGKTPASEISCPKIFGFKASCQSGLLSEFQSNGVNGAIFKSSGTVEAACSDGGKGTLLSEGEALGVQVS